MAELQERQQNNSGEVEAERVSEQHTAQISEKQARTWAMVCHLSAFAGFIIPLGNIIAPLVIWLIKRAESPFIDDQGKEALNFQISMIIYAVISWIFVTIFIGYLLLFAVGIFDIVMVIMAALKANEGERFRYPLCIRFIK